MSCCVPVRDVGVEVGFETLEGLPVLAAKKLVLEVSEDLFGGIIVLVIALFMGIAEKISSMPSGDN